jgi:putative flippase GtrA
VIEVENKLTYASALFLFVLGFLVLLDQFVKIGVWFQFRDIHHETVALVFFALGVGFLAGFLMYREQK